MRRTHVYLDDDLWTTLHARAQSEKTTVSELVRIAVRERYFGRREERARAMQEFIGIRKGRADMADVDAYVASLRRGRRIPR